MLQPSSLARKDAPRRAISILRHRLLGSVDLPTANGRGRHVPALIQAFAERFAGGKAWCLRILATHTCIHANLSVMSSKDVGLRIRVEKELREAFQGACTAENRVASDVLREFMRSYADRYQDSRQANLFAGTESTASKLLQRTE